MLTYLGSERGGAALRDADRDGDVSERAFHSHLKQTVEPDIGRLLDAIDAYERFCRLIHDAFYACLAYYSGGYTHPIAPSELAGIDAVKTATREACRAFEHAEARLEPQDEGQAFRDTFGPLAEAPDATAFVEALLDHYRRTQRRKPPDGKAPWLAIRGRPRSGPPAVPRPRNRPRQLSSIARSQKLGPIIRFCPISRPSSSGWEEPLPATNDELHGKWLYAEAASA